MNVHSTHDDRHTVLRMRTNNIRDIWQPRASTIPSLNYMLSTKRKKKGEGESAKVRVRSCEGEGSSIAPSPSHLRTFAPSPSQLRAFAFASSHSHLRSKGEIAKVEVAPSEHHIMVI